MAKFDFIATDVLIEQGEGFTDVIEFTASDIELYEGEVLELSDVLKEYTKTIETTTFTTSMQEIEAKFDGKHDLQGEELQFELGARETYLHPSSDNEWLNFGTFKVVETEYDDASNETTIVAYDNMIKFHVDYSAEEMGLSYPQSIYNILKRTCEVVGVELATHDFFNKLKRVEEDKWANRGQVTYRNVLDDIAEATLSYIYIQDNKLHVAPYNETNEVISEENLSDLVVGDKYGAVNMLNLTREPQHDNLVRPTNWTDIPRDERVEIVIDTNQIMDKRREDYIDGLYERIKGFEYYPFEAKSFGYGFFNAGDKVTVKDVDGNEYTSYIHKSVLKVTNGLSEELSADIPKQAKEEYAVVTDQQRKDIRTYLIVDQQNGKIEGLVEDVGGLEDKQSKFEQSLDEISLKVEGLNNNANIIPNLNGNLENYLGWEFEDTRSAPFVKGMPFRQFMPFNVNFEIKTLDNSLSQWGLSFFANGTAITGLGYVVPTQVYSFRAKRHKGTQPFSVTVRQYDKDKKHLRDRKMTFDSPSNYEAFTIKLMDDVRYVRLAFDVNATLDNRLELTEMMFNRGNPKEWQESAGDVRLYAETELKVLDSEIRSTVEEIKVVDGKTEQNRSQILQQADQIGLEASRIDSLNNDIHNAGVEINAVDGVTTYGKNFRVMDSSRNKELLAVHTIAGQEQLVIDINNGSVGNFSIQDGVMEFTTPEYYREYSSVDMNYIKNFYLSNQVATSVDKMIYDLNGDGKIDGFDAMIIKRHILGTQKIKKIVKTNIKVGTKDGKIVITTFYKQPNGNFTKGEVTTVGSSYVKSQSVIASSVYTDSLAIGGYRVERQSDGTLKATQKVMD